MNLTVLAWLVVFLGLTVMSFRRPAYGVLLYLQTYYAAPMLWWWGSSISDVRWSLISSLVLLASVLFHGGLGKRTTRATRWLLAAMVLNCTLVHLFLADRIDVSENAYTHVTKFTTLFFVMCAAIRDRSDLKLVLSGIVIGSMYLGYEATINQRGHGKGGRLEGIGCPEAVGSNEVAALLVTYMPLCGAFLFAKSLRERMLAILAAPLIVNTVLLCNSRGAFLATILAGVVFVTLSPRGVRGKAFLIAVLGAIGASFLLNDEKILNRFVTVFADSEERDASAAGRMDFWKAGLRFIADYPLGAGGDHYRRVHGRRYRIDFGHDEDRRSIHNGYLNEACDWGLQALVLHLMFFGAGMHMLRKTGVICSQTGDTEGALMAVALLSGFAGFMLASLFGDFFDNEYGYWIMALAASHYTLTTQATGEGQADALAMQAMAWKPYGPPLELQPRFDSTRTPLHSTRFEN